MASEAWFRYRWTVGKDEARIHGEAASARLREAPSTVGSVFSTDGGTTWLVEAKSVTPLDDGQHEALSDIIDRKIPRGSDLSKDVADNVQRWLSGEAQVLVLPVLGAPLRALIEERREDLGLQARRFYELLRWLTNATGTHRPLVSGRLEFSLDNETWAFAPKNPPGAPVNLRVDSGLGLDWIDWEAFSNFALTGESEPVGHSLIREALALRQSAPRSALVIGAAAAETSVKEAIHRLAPEATFLMDEMQAPSTFRLVRDYLPSLSSRGADPNLLMPLPSELKRSIQWITSTRNNVVHNRQQAHSFPELLTALLHVRDLVWILDYHCGHEWAIQHVSQQLRRGTTH